MVKEVPAFRGREEKPDESSGHGALSQLNHRFRVSDTVVMYRCYRKSGRPHHVRIKATGRIDAEEVSYVENLISAMLKLNLPTEILRRRLDGTSTDEPSFANVSVMLGIFDRVVGWLRPDEAKSTVVETVGCDECLRRLSSDELATFCPLCDLHVPSDLVH